MAKLSARGRTELARVRIVREQMPGTASSSDLHGTGRTERTLLSDGVVLQKRTWFHADGRKDFGDGWKAYGKQNVDVDAWISRYLESGWERVKRR